jgi:hypothetical protein
MVLPSPRALRRLLLLAVAAPVAPLLVAACSPTESDIRDAIEDANHCSAVSDCVDVGTVCPFGCNILVNKSEAQRIRDMLDGYESTCAYDCAAPKGVACTGGRCTTQ